MEIEYNGENVNLPYSSTYNDRLKPFIRFYSLKFHFIGVPIILIIAIIHLKFSIQYFGQCPIQPMINIYMIVHAVIHLSLMILTFIGVINIHCIHPHFQYKHQIIPRIILIVILIGTLVLLLFSLSWLIAGSVWIFGAKTNGVQGSDPTKTTTYCQSNLFRAALTLLIVNYVIHGIIVLIFLFRYIYRKRQQPSINMNSVENRI